MIYIDSRINLCNNSGSIYRQQAYSWNIQARPRSLHSPKSLEALNAPGLPINHVNEDWIRIRANLANKIPHNRGDKRKAYTAEEDYDFHQEKAQPFVAKHENDNIKEIMGQEFYKDAKVELSRTVIRGWVEKNAADLRNFEAPQSMREELLAKSTSDMKPSFRRLFEPTSAYRELLHIVMNPGKKKSPARNSLCKVWVHLYRSGSQETLCR
jgi:hypothetical protein